MSRQRRPASSRAGHAAEPATDLEVPVASAPAPREASASPAFGAVFYFCLGAIAMKLVLGLFPQGIGIVDVLVYAGIAISVAIAYRRFVRRSLEARRRERQRQQERAARS